MGELLPVLALGPESSAVVDMFKVTETLESILIEGLKSLSLIESIGNLLLSFEIFNSHGRDFEIY